MTYSNISVHNSDWADFTLELVENDEGEKKLDSKLKIKKEIPDDALVALFLLFSYFFFIYTIILNCIFLLKILEEKVKTRQKSRYVLCRFCRFW